MAQVCHRNIVVFFVFLLYSWFFIEPCRFLQRRLKSILDVDLRLVIGVYWAMTGGHHLGLPEWRRCYLCWQSSGIGLVVGSWMGETLLIETGWSFLFPLTHMNHGPIPTPDNVFLVHGWMVGSLEAKNLSQVYFKDMEYDTNSSPFAYYT